MRVAALAAFLLVAAAAPAAAAPAPGAATVTVGGEKQVFKRRATTLADRARSLLGVPFLVGVAWLLSNNRRRFPWRVVVWGAALQIALACVVLDPRIAEFFFEYVDAGMHRLLSFVEVGVDFVMQSVSPHKIAVPDPSAPGGFSDQVFVGRISPPLKNLAFWVLPSIIFFSSLMALLYHLGVMQKLVAGFAWVMQWTMKTSGAETLSCAANIFVGQTEAPLLVRPFVGKMTQSELMAMMTGGFATIAGGVMAVYVSVLRDIPGIAGHLLVASIISAPAALVMAKVMFPETETPETAGTLRIHVERRDANAIAALARGASEGLTLTLNVAAMLIAFVAMVALVNYLLSLVGTSLQTILGWLNAPFALMMGVPLGESRIVGQILGERLVLTEMLAYLHLGEIVGSGRAELSRRSAVIATYSLCGFANLASIGIQIGGIGPMAPHRSGDLARLGMRAMIAGTLASYMTGTVAGLFLG